MRLSRLLFATVFVSLFLTGCREAPRSAEAAVNPQPVATPVIVVISAEWPDLYEAVGTVRARTSAVIASKIMGYVREAKVRSGDTVASGQPLVTIDSRDLDIAVRQAEASRQETLSARGEADNAVTSAQANLDLAKATFRRIQDLFQKTSVSNQEYDEATARLKAAQAALDMATARRAQVSAKIQQAEEAVSAAEVMRGYAEIRAPFAGTITEKPVEPGSMAVPGTPLLTIEQKGALRLEVPVQESFLRQVRVGQPVTVTLDSLDRTLETRISEIGPLIDPAARALPVKIDLPDIPQLRAGAYGRAKFRRGARSVVAIPIGAVLEQGQLASVLVIEQERAHARMVTLGERRGDQVEILSGLERGERIVFPRSSAIADGARLEVRP